MMHMRPMNRTMRRLHVRPVIRAMRVLNMRTMPRTVVRAVVTATPIVPAMRGGTEVNLDLDGRRLLSVRPIPAPSRLRIGR
jgi:hypothetical protein